VIGAVVPLGGLIQEPALNLVGDGERREEVPSTGALVLAGRQDRRQGVAGMAGLACSQIAVVEVQVPDRRPVVERHAVGRRASASDHGAQRPAPEVVHLPPDGPNGLGSECPEGAAQRIEHADLELLDRLGGEVLEGPPDDEAGEILREGHGGPPRT
jgi:hypothetical protein